jgi:tRNA 2-selenouridine synthase
LILETPIERRVENTREEYIDEALLEYRRRYGDDRGFMRWSQSLLDSLKRIRKRLGETRYRSLLESMSSAIDHQRRSGDSSAHRGWLHVLLHEYYDPMYDYQIGKNRPRIQFSGSESEILEYLDYQ